MRSLKNNPGQQKLIEIVLNKFNPMNVGIPLMRFGSREDGGYLISDDTLGIDRCISFGCGSNVKFEEEFTKNTGIPFSIFDAKVNFPPNHKGYIHNFIDGWLGDFSSPITNDTPTYTLESALRESGGGDFLNGILKIDIESSEYSLLLQAKKEDLSKFRIIIIEFHRLNELKSSSIFCHIVDEVMNKLLSSFYVTHFHSNNAVKPFRIANTYFPGCIEISLLRKDRAKYKSPEFGEYKHSLDMSNNSRRKELVVRFPIKLK